MVQHSPSLPRESRALAPDDFSFFGFDDLDNWLERRLQNVEIRGGTPQVSIVENTVYVPQRVAQIKGSQRAEVVKSLLESPAVAYAQYEHEIDEEVVYLGWWFDHFGHFLMQSLARTWFLTEVSPSVRVLFDPPHRAWRQPTGWVHRMLEAFGVPPERILILNAPTRLRRLIIPEPLFEPRGVAQDSVVRAHAAMARPYQAVAKRLAGDTTPSEQPLYLSRQRLPPSQRTIVGEGDLEEVLRANGFRIAHTETMTFEDQVRLVNEHADIFSNAGSAAHNVLFALHEPRLHLLTNGRTFSPDYFLYLTIVGASTSFINCLNTGGRPTFERAYKQTPHLLDTPKLLEYLDQRGFLTTPMPVWPSGYRTELKAQYDEAWLYGYIRGFNQGSALPLDLEREALSLASSSWPISLVLARYYTRRDPQRANSLARQFAHLAAAETDVDQLARYRAEVAEMAPKIIKQCSRDTAARLHGVATDCFLVTALR
ncbi:MAG: glycosyltransferase family 61 protein [Thermomicrobiales bacterium]|nr:glycosyltransferase family 61 protein [Thermomicrobiales bacterium]